MSIDIFCKLIDLESKFTKNKTSPSIGLRIEAQNGPLRSIKRTADP
jgi:hypothetical protein